MTLQTVVTLIDTLVPPGALGDEDNATPDDEAIAPASQGFLESLPAALGFSFATSQPISSIVIRLKGEAHISAPPSVVWNSSGGRIKWRVGSDQDERMPTSPLPKDTGVPAYIETTPILTQPNGDDWTASAINDLEVWDRVVWQAAALGNVVLAIVEARVLVYGEQEADVRATAVGAGDPEPAWVGTVALTGSAVGVGEPALAWVGEEE